MPDDTALPERLLPERFELGELVGSGGVADVYRAHDRRLDRPVAVKFFRRDPADRVDDEVRALARLSHAGLVTIFDVGTHDGLPYLVLELVTGPSLKARLSAGPLTVAETVALGTALAGALAHAHERGVVHRDVKPANILLDGHGVPHLADLGIALLIGGQRRTRTNEILGTPAYLAPEQVLGDAIGPPVDVYALGLVLLECLSGKVEYGEGNELAAALVRLNRPPRIPAGLPEGLAELLVEMTATEPRRRPTASQCEQRLTAATTPLARPLCAASLRADPLHAARTGRRSRRVPMAAAGIGIVALVAGLFFLPGGDPPTPSRIAANQPVDTTVAPVPTTSEQPVTVAPALPNPPPAGPPPQAGPPHGPPVLVGAPAQHNGKVGPPPGHVKPPKKH